MTDVFAVAVIDDESDARALVKHHLNRHNQLKLVGEAKNGSEALELIENLNPDLIFLDIQMPAYNGIEVLKKAGKIPHVIFVTAYDNFAVKAFELNAVDYLLKPFTAKRFDQAVFRATSRLNDPITQETLYQLIDQLQLKKSTYLKRLTFKHKNATEYIDIDDVHFIMAANQYVEVYVKSKKKYVLRQSMDYLEKQLHPNTFIRIHRSVIVRLSLIRAIQQDEFKHYQVVLTTGETLPLSQVRKPLLANKLNT